MGVPRLPSGSYGEAEEGGTLALFLLNVGRKMQLCFYKARRERLIDLSTETLTPTLWRNYYKHNF